MHLHKVVAARSQALLSTLTEILTMVERLTAVQIAWRFVSKCEANVHRAIHEGGASARRIYVQPHALFARPWRLVVSLTLPEYSSRSPFND